jgi:hypothetical protein
MFVFTFREEFSMPTLAAYKAILHGEITLPTPDSNDHEFHMFTTPDVDVGTSSILAFRVDPYSIPVHLQVVLNSHSFEHTFNTVQNRSWHEIIPKNVLRAENQLVIAVIADTNPVGSIKISEIVLFFQVNIP